MAGRNRRGNLPAQVAWSCSIFVRISGLLAIIKMHTKPRSASHSSNCVKHQPQAEAASSNFGRRHVCHQRIARGIPNTLADSIGDTRQQDDGSLISERKQDLVEGRKGIAKHDQRLAAACPIAHGTRKNLYEGRGRLRNPRSIRPKPCLRPRQSREKQAAGHAPSPMTFPSTG